MAPLEALEQDFRLIDSSFRIFCAAHGIFTVEDFLVHDLYELEAFAERDYKQEKLKQGIRQMVSILEHKHKPWLNGMELLEDAEVNKCTLSSGWERIDVLLQGGLREGHITELVGPSSSGKTQVCLKCASHVARSYSGMVMFFDTGNSFSAKRIAQFLSLTSGAANIEIKKTVQQVMSSIVCHSIFDMFTLLDMLRQLKNNLTSQVGCQVRMLIIDSLSSLIAPILGGGGVHGHALMLTTGFLLKELANEHNLSVLVAAFILSFVLASMKHSYLQINSHNDSEDLILQHFNAALKSISHMLTAEAKLQIPS
ncbi:DNA repair protein RAD51 homolog 4 [Striga asiatica]|uniref:DNA repair protein RAD51 homolog 4 n=1 Tax=Striga asiatica TaxID=4170 RepID=A0A5A7Q228_STRAF|nr:DNA repair protein RAD51 homolog 4 [Striga asiatica]